MPRTLTINMLWWWKYLPGLKIFTHCFQPALLPLFLTSLPLFSCQLFLGHIQSTLPLFPLHIFLTTPLYVSPSHSLAAPIIFRQVCIASTTITTSTSNCPHASLCLPIMFQFFWASNDAEGVLLAPPQSGQKFSTPIFFFIEQQKRGWKAKFLRLSYARPPPSSPFIDRTAFDESTKGPTPHILPSTILSFHPIYTHSLCRTFPIYPHQTPPDLICTYTLLPSASLIFDQLF